MKRIDPTRPPGRLRRAFAAVSDTRIARFVSRHVSWRIDPILLRVSRGRLSTTFMIPSAVLETRGARTGVLRRHAVIYFHDGDRVVILASNAGGPRHPAWFHNLRVHPDVTLGGLPMRATVVESKTERERLWGHADRVFPAFAAFRRRAEAAQRQIPIVSFMPRQADFLTGDSPQGSRTRRRSVPNFAASGDIPRAFRRCVENLANCPLGDGGTRMRLPSAAHTSRPWRIHDLTNDFRLEDVWKLQTPGGPNDLPRLAWQMATGGAEGSSGTARALWALRWRIGALLGWDGPEAGVGSRVPTLRHRLPPDLREAPSGPHFDVLPFTSLYLLDDEWAAEIANRTVHGVLHVGWVPDGEGGYRGQMAVLVKPNGLFGAAYMAAILPFRRLIVYPSLMRQIERGWRSAGT